MSDKSKLNKAIADIEKQFSSSKGTPKKEVKNFSSYSDGSRTYVSGISDKHTLEIEKEHLNKALEQMKNKESAFYGKVKAKIQLKLKELDAVEKQLSESNMTLVDQYLNSFNEESNSDKEIKKNIIKYWSSKGYDTDAYQEGVIGRPDKKTVTIAYNIETADRDPENSDVRINKKNRVSVEFFSHNGEGKSLKFIKQEIVKKFSDVKKLSEGKISLAERYLGSFNE